MNIKSLGKGKLWNLGWTVNGVEVHLVGSVRGDQLCKGGDPIKTDQ
jgi:hypothetical protein